jgi:trans-2,3-dihydro-3-hydroxyanthranilate isomerase
MPDLPTYLYDAFAAAPFGGNVAGVVLPPQQLPARMMQGIANELGAPTTGFAVRRDEGTLAWDVRYFTPRREIDLCGYVAVAVFTALADVGEVVPQPSGVRAWQYTAAGALGIDVFATHAGIEVEMAQRSPVIEDASRVKNTLLALLGDAVHACAPPVIASTGLRHLLIGFDSAAAVTRLTPDFRGLGQLSRELEVDTVAAFALLAPGEDPGGARVHLRDFCPGIGADEEAASGTTSGALASYLVAIEGVPAAERREAHVRVRQGVELGRPSVIDAYVAVEKDRPQQVRVRGRAMRTLEGKFRVPDEVG